MIRIVTLCVVMLLIVTPCMAQTVTLAWDLSTSEPLGTGGGYRIYMSKQSMVYGTTPAAIASPGATTTTVANVPYGRTYFVATAFVQDGTESDYSNEVSTVIKPKPPKLNTVQQVAQAVKGAVVKLAGLFKGHKNLRIVG